MFLFSCSVLSDSLQPHGLYHVRLPCPSLSPGVCSNSCPLSWWCHPPSHPLSPSSPLALNLSQHQALRITWPKYWSFSFSISSFSEYLGIISFRMDWLDLLAVHGIFESLLQHHSSKPSISCSALSLQRMVQLSGSYMTTGKAIAFIIQIFVSKIMSLLFNTLSRFVIAFLTRNKSLLILWLQTQGSLPGAL